MGGELANFNINEIAGACSLILGSLGGLLLICFKSRCSSINYSCFWGLFRWNCIRQLPDDSSDDENSSDNNDKNDKNDKKKNVTKKNEAILHPRTTEPQP